VIQSHLKKGLTIEKCLEIVTRVRDEHIGQSPLLMRYREESNFFGKRLQALEKSVIDFEHTMLNDLLVSYFHSSNAITSAQALKTNKPCLSCDS
jgi:tryptophan synthase alpha subunit